MANTLEDFLREHSAELELIDVTVGEKNIEKVRWKLTGYECARNIDALAAYKKAKKYQKALKKSTQSTVDLSKYPTLSAHKSDSTKLWCYLTKRSIHSTNRAGMTPLIRHIGQANA
eukprot:389151_1